MITTTPALDRQSRALSPAPITASGRDDSLPDAADQRLGLDLVATLGLTAYSVTVAVGFSRVFFEWDFLRDLVLIAVAGHGASYVLRRLRAPSFVAIPLLLLGLTWLVAWIYYRDTFSSVFPLSDTWNAVRDDYRMVQDEFQSTTPPVVYDAGWAFLAGATTAATVWLSDTFAFRAQARGEALVPGAVLFVFIAALGVDEHRVACSLAVIGAGFVALALLRLRLERRPRTVLGRARHPLLTITPGVVCAAALVMAGAWAIAPRLPGADADPLFDTHNRRGGVTEIVSPLVDIRSRIVNQADTEMFTVAAERAVVLADLGAAQVRRQPVGRRRFLARGRRRLAQRAGGRCGTERPARDDRGTRRLDRARRPGAGRGVDPVRRWRHVLVR